MDKNGLNRLKEIVSRRIKDIEESGVTVSPKLLHCRKHDHERQKFIRAAALGKEYEPVQRRVVFISDCAARDRKESTYSLEVIPPLQNVTSVELKVHGEHGYMGFDILEMGPYFFKHTMEKRCHSTMKVIHQITPPMLDTICPRVKLDHIVPVLPSITLGLIQDDFSIRYAHMPRETTISLVFTCLETKEKRLV
ncbi:MAG: hypothetical protein K0U20_08220 [Proteobacteria bacterium]|nr:hypothetical protein [Pseudomonadota bacterium]